MCVFPLLLQMRRCSSRRRRRRDDDAGDDGGDDDDQCEPVWLAVKEDGVSILHHASLVSEGIAGRWEGEPGHY